MKDIDNKDEYAPTKDSSSEFIRKMYTFAKRSVPYIQIKEGAKRTIERLNDTDLKSMTIDQLYQSTMTLERLLSHPLIGSRKLREEARKLQKELYKTNQEKLYKIEGYKREAI